MFRIIKKIDRKKLLKALNTIAYVVVFSIPLFFMTENVFARVSGGDGGAGSPCSNRYCYTSKHAGWIRIHMDNDPMDATDIARALGYSSSIDLNYGTKPHGCSGIGSGDVYILVAPVRDTWVTPNKVVGVAGPLSLSDSYGFYPDGDFATNLGTLTNASGFNNHFVSALGDALPAYNEYRSDFIAAGVSPYDEPSEEHTSDLGWFCADGPTIKNCITNPELCPPEEHPEEQNPQCAESPNGWASANLGNTVGRSGILNLTYSGSTWNNSRNTDWSFYGANTAFDDSFGVEEVHMYAKPGDSIRFRHSYCFGARAIRDSNGRHIAPASNSNKPTIPDNNFTINGYRNSAVNNKYTFTDGMGTPSSMFNSRITLSGKNTMVARPNIITTKDDGSGTMKVVDYGFTIYSPGKLEANYKNYQCDYDSLPAITYQGVNYKNKGYQIPGFYPGYANCDSASHTDAMNAGVTISQGITFNRLETWERWSTSYSGSCGCDVDDAQVDDVAEHDTFASALGHYPLFGEFHWNRCKRSCKKCCNCYTVGSGTSARTICPDPYYVHKPTDSNTVDSKTHYTDRYEVRNNQDFGGTNVDIAKRATAYIPFNYRTSVRSSLSGGDIVYQGSTISGTFNWDIKRRYNNKTTSTDGTENGGLPNGYATPLPTTGQVQIVEFVTQPGISSDNSLLTEDYNSSASPYNRFSSIAEKINIIDTRTDHLNQAGNYAGDSGSATYSRAIPDDKDYVGQKFCVAVGIYPSNSHGDSGFAKAQLDNSDAAQQGKAMSQTNSNTWDISGVSCRTIAKKPTFQVWGNSVYTEGSINTSITTKLLGVALGGSTSGPRTQFGSWSEVGATVNGQTKGFGTGASLGYKLDSFNYGLPGGHSQVSSEQELGYLTISNTSNPPGNSRVLAGAANKAVLSQIYARYRDPIRRMVKERRGAEIGDNNTIYTTDTGFEYVFVNGGGNWNISNLTNVTAGTNSGTINLSGSLMKGAAPSHGTDNTLVIYAKSGTNVIIDRNICYTDNATECNYTANPDDDSNKALQLDSYSLSVDGIDKLPQILIIADNITVTQNVTRVDAWLVSTSNINTCKEGPVNADTCATALVVNGPIFARTVTLNRTAGMHAGKFNYGPLECEGGCTTDVLNRNIGGQNDGSIAPAEVFNFRYDAYLWAYNQSSRYTEAVATYTRELAPRY